MTTSWQRRSAAAQCGNRASCVCQRSRNTTSIEAATLEEVVWARLEALEEVVVQLQGKVDQLTVAMQAAAMSPPVSHSPPYETSADHVSSGAHVERSDDMVMAIVASDPYAVVDEHHDDRRSAQQIKDALSVQMVSSQLHDVTSSMAAARAFLRRQ